MKTIKKQEEISFNCIDFKDAVVVLPLMNELVKAINNLKLFKLYNSLPKEEREKYRSLWKNTDICLTDESVENIFTILTKLGFESQFDIKEPTLDDLELKNK